MSDRPLLICRFDPNKTGLERFFGPQEAATMAALWAEDRPMTVKATWRRLQRDYKDVAYTTVMTTMTRLWDKAVLDRAKTGFSYTYRVRETREEFEARMEAAIRESLETQ